MRYFQPTLKDYTSSFVPTELPFELMLKSLDNKQAAYDKTQADIDTTGDLFKVNKGLNYASSWGEADLAKPFKDELEAINNDLASGKKQPQQAAREVINLKRKFDQDKEIKAANLDYNLTMPWMQARLKDPNAIGTLYNGRTITPKNISGLSDAEISNLYGMQSRGQFEEEHKELAATLRDEISQKNYEEYKRRSGGIEPKINQSTGMIETTHGNPLLAKEINAKTAYDVFDKYAKANFDSSNKESVKYMQMENNIGLGNHTAESYRDRLYNTFSGLYGIHDLSGGYNKSAHQLSDSGNDYGKYTNTVPGSQYSIGSEATQRGIDNVEKLKGHVMSFLKGKYTQQELIPGTGSSTYAMTPGGNTREIDFKWKNLSPDQKEIIAHYFETKDPTGKGKFSNFAQRIRKGENMDWLRDQSVYKKMMEQDFSNPEFLKRMEKIDIKSNNTIQDVPYNKEGVWLETGIRNSETNPASLYDLLASNISKNKVVKIDAEGNKIPYKNIAAAFKDTDPNTHKNTAISVGKYLPANNLKLAIGDGDNWANAFNITINGEDYIVQAGKNPLTIQEANRNEAINHIYNSLEFSLPGTKLDLGNGRLGYYDDNIGYFDNKGNIYGGSKEGAYNIFMNQPIGKLEK